MRYGTSWPECRNVPVLPSRSRTAVRNICTTIPLSGRQQSDNGHASFIHNRYIRGCTGLALDFAPLPQDFKLPGRRAEVKPKPAFFQEQREGFSINAVIFA